MTELPKRAPPPSMKQMLLVAGLSALLGIVAGLVWLLLLPRPESLPKPVVSPETPDSPR